MFETQQMTLSAEKAPSQVESPKVLSGSYILSENEAAALAQPPPPPNGGFNAWLQVFGAFFLFFNSW